MASPAVGVNVALPGVNVALPGLNSLAGLPPMDLGSNSSSALNTSGSLYHASGDGDWVVNFGAAGQSGFGGFGSVASAGLGGASAGEGIAGAAAVLSSPIVILLIAGAAWFLLKK